MKYLYTLILYILFHELFILFFFEQVHISSIKEYEVIMNRIWPPLITVICALVIKRFLPTVTVAIATAFCWLIVFLTGPLSKYWLSEWQEIAFVVLAQCVVLVGAKSEDRQERENFLNVRVFLKMLFDLLLVP